MSKAANEQEEDPALSRQESPGAASENLPGNKKFQAAKKAKAKTEELFKDISAGIHQRKNAKKTVLRFFEHPHLDRLRQIFETQHYDAFISSVVLFNLILIVVETDCEGQGEPVPGWVQFMNILVLIAFVMELILKIIVYQKSFVKNFWNLLDFCIVGIDICSLIFSALIGNMPRMSIFRIARLVRLTRSVKFLSKFPELGLMLSALRGALKSMAWGTLLLALFLTIFGIMAVQIIHPINQTVTNKGIYDGCERCPRAFETVWMAVLTTFQTDVAGDSWGQVAVPISEESPLAWLFFCAVIVLLQMLVMNVILAAVLDSATQARFDNVEIIAKEKEQEMHSFRKKLIQLCIELDQDQSGSLSHEEVVEGFKSNEEFFDIMEAMDIFAEDIAAVWGILDKNHNGVVDYEEFSEELFRLKSEDTHTMTVFIKYQVAQIQELVSAEMDKLKEHTKMIASMTEAFSICPESFPEPPLREKSSVDTSGGENSQTIEAQVSQVAPSPSTQKFQNQGAPALQASCEAKSTEVKLSMPLDVPGCSELEALKLDLSQEIFNKCRAVEVKLDATRSTIDSLVETVQKNAAREDAQSMLLVPQTSNEGPELLSVPADAGRPRCIPAFCCTGSSGVGPPPSSLSIERSRAS